MRKWPDIRSGGAAVTCLITQSAEVTVSGRYDTEGRKLTKRPRATDSAAEAPGQCLAAILAALPGSEHPVRVTTGPV